MGRRDLFTCRHWSQNALYFPFTPGDGSPGTDHSWRQTEGSDVFVFQTWGVWRFISYPLAFRGTRGAADLVWLA